MADYMETPDIADARFGSWIGRNLGAYRSSVRTGAGCFWIWEARLLNEGENEADGEGFWLFTVKCWPCGKDEAPFSYSATAEYKADNLGSLAVTFERVEIRDAIDAAAGVVTEFRRLGIPGNENARNPATPEIEAEPVEMPF